MAEPSIRDNPPTYPRADFSRHAAIKSNKFP